MVKNGFGAPFWRAYYKKQELTNTDGRFSYVYAEEEDDQCTLNFKLDKPEDVDLPQYQEGAELEIVWGYIEGETTRRTVWIHNAVPTFGKDNITLAIEASEKAAVTMKGDTERVIHKGKGLPGLVLDKADKHGLKAEVEINPYEGIVLDALPTGHDLIPDNETSTQFIRRLNEEKARRTTVQNLKDYQKNQQQLKTNPTKYRRDLKELYSKWQPQWESSTQLTAEIEAEKKKNAEYVNKKLEVLRKGGAPGSTLDLYTFNTDNNIVQAGKSDMQIIKDTAKRTKGGPTIVETRDNRIILKKRDFRQKPYRSYEYQGSDGELLEFRPETKNKQAGAAASNMVASGWNAINKNYFQTAADPSNPANNPALAKAIALKKQYGWLQKAGGGGKIVGKREQFIGMMPGVVEVNPQRPQFDKTRKHGEPMVAKIKITVDDAVSALDKAINDYTGQVDGQQREVYNALGVNPEAAFNDASNKQQNNELKTNPATMQTWGDPRTETGFILTILHASKKHSGNYYITKTSHEIDKSSGYITTYEGYKHGHNIISGPDYVPAASAGRVVNREIGENKTQQTRTKVPKIKSNGK